MDANALSDADLLDLVDNHCTVYWQHVPQGLAEWRLDLRARVWYDCT